MCHILIIEDEPLVAMLLSDLLADEGATSFAYAATQSDAIASALSHRPVLITADVMLAQGTGPRAIEEIHKQLGQIPVIFITGTPGECIPCDPPGKILCKPVVPSELATTFHEMVPAGT